MVPCNLAEDVFIPEHEQFDIVYVETEAKLFNQETGEKISRPKKEKYRIRVFEQMDKKGYFKGKTVKILHDPRLEQEVEYEKQKTNGTRTTETD